ncbi:MAG: NmrA family NAD(P)-binding protein [Cyanobacteria bacterium Co-bin13]|nr:NmrA family NAD(P)-binding protein [Cyanobacteria bacterium Co-bin13]
MTSPPDSLPNPDPAEKVLLIGVTGGTGHNVVKGFLDQNLSGLCALTRRADLQRPALARLVSEGIELVEADLDDEASLERAFAGVSAIYCHATAPDTAKPDPLEVERAERVARAAQKANIRHLVYNSAGGADRNSGIGHIEQKHRVEQVFTQAVPTTLLRACLFMEEFWKKYTRPSILKGTFSFAVQPDRPLHLITTRDMGRVAAYVIRNREQYVGRAIELAGDVLTPQQMATEFSKAQEKPVKYREVPPWIFLLLFRKSLFDLVQWYRHHGYQADVAYLRQEFPELLTPFSTFLAETDWANSALTYQDL